MKLSEHLLGIALVEESSEVVGDALEGVLTRYGPVERRRFNSWSEARETLVPLRSFPTRYLVIPLESWTAIVCDMSCEVCHVDALAISGRLQRRALSAAMRDSARSFHLVEDGKEVRSILAYEDGPRWTFFQEGVTQPWEEVDAYRKRSPRDRLTPDRVSAYCRAVTGLQLPPEWNTLAGPFLGLGRSTASLRVPVRDQDVEIDL